MSLAHRGCIASLATLLLAPIPVASQGLRFTEATRTESRITKPADPDRIVTTLGTGKIRTDDTDGTSTIYDWADGKVVMINHGEKTWSTMTMKEMLAATEQMMGLMKGMSDSLAGAMQQVKRAVDSAGITSEMEFKMEDLGDGGSIAGFAARHHFLTVTLRQTARPDPSGPPVTMTMVVAADVWLSREFAALKSRLESQQASAASREIRARLEATGEAAREMMASPGMEGMSAGVQRLNAELGKIDGAALRMLTYYIQVPPGGSFDRQAILDQADRPIPTMGGVGGMMKESFKQGARELLGGGLFGRKKKEATKADLAQVIMMRSTMTVEDIQQGSLPADAFAVPGGYRQTPPDFMTRAR